MWPFDRKNQVIFRPLDGRYYTGGRDKPLWMFRKSAAMRFTYTDAISVLDALGINGAVVTA